MSNPQAQGSQGIPPQGPKLLKAEDITQLRCLTDDQKQKYRPVLTNFWTMIQTKPAGSAEYAQARAKLLEWSSKLIQQEKIYRTKQQQQLQGQMPNQQNSQNPQSQNPPNPQNPQNSMAPPNPQAQQAPQPGNDAQPLSQPAQPPKPQNVAQPQPQQNPQQGINRPQGGPAPANPPAPHNPEVLKHVEGFPYRLPPNIQPGTPDAEKRLKEMKNSYLAALTKQERTSARVRALSENFRQRQSAGQEIPQELLNQKQQEEAQYQGAKKFVDDFRKKQAEWRSSGLPAHGQQQQQQLQGANQVQPQSSMQMQGQSQPQNAAHNPVKQEPAIKLEGGQAPQPAQSFTGMQSGGAPQQHQQNPVGPGPQPQQAPRPPPLQHQNQPPFGQPGQQHQPQRPQINPQQANAQAQHQINSPHPHSATSAGPAGPPVPLSHQAAVTAAQRSYSNPDAQRTATPMQPGQGNFNPSASREREQMNNPKLPIPRTLNTASPVPVSMGQSRPTMSGPTNGAPGALGQPVINKFPPFQLEGEGDRVLSKRKLDELVRQVTGGSEDALTPEVEEAMLQLADDFVDSVITSACKLSKLRESSNLEIRDLQVVLERNYNIRIPGYSSDEIRTVRKLVPAPGWTTKMNAVQSAKVIGGKTDT